MSGAPKTTTTHCPVCALELRGSTWCSLQKPGCPMPAAPPGDVLDAECERILAMTDAEVLADCRARGEDPEDARRWGLAILDRAMMEVADRAT
jgi:hypothetical protein